MTPSTSSELDASLDYFDTNSQSDSEQSMGGELVFSREVDAMPDRVVIERPEYRAPELNINTDRNRDVELIPDGDLRARIEQLRRQGTRVRALDEDPHRDTEQGDRISSQNLRIGGGDSASVENIGGDQHQELSVMPVSQSESSAGFDYSEEHGDC